MSDKETSFKKFKGEILYVKTKSLLRKLVQKLFLKLLSILSGNKFLFYKNKIIIILNRFVTFFRFYFDIIFLRLKYPLYLSLSSKHLYAISATNKFLKILKPKKIDFFLMAGSLLGAIRQESFAGRPKDVDLGIKEHHVSKLLDSVPLLVKHGATYIRVMSKHKEQKLQVTLDGIRIDIEFFRKEKYHGIEMWLGATNEETGDINNIPIPDLENLKPVKLYGKTFMSPANPEIYLERKYGKNWRIPDNHKEQFFWKKN
jgi:hypothetical protein